MARIRFSFVGTFLLILLTACPSYATQQRAYSHQKDVIYSRKFGTALTLDVFTPKKVSNGAAVIFVLSAGWRSDSRYVFLKAQPGKLYPQVREVSARGYTVFTVVHGSQPKYTIPEIIDDLNRAVRFIRYNAHEFMIDAGRIGIWGASSGGYLALIQGMAGDRGMWNSKDPVDQTSGRVQAVVAYFPVTDFLNFGKIGTETSGGPYAAALDFQEFDDKSHGFVRITDESRIRAIKRQISPTNYVTPDDPPTLIFHGDADRLIPLQQSELIISKLKEAKVDSRLVVKHGGGHGWEPTNDELKEFGDWFDKYLLRHDNDNSD
ncbi:MAG: alpha/beta hydrolase [Thermodesulfobacteriota bacterium]